MSPLYWFLEILAVAAFVCEVWGFVDALRRPAKAFLAAGKQNKPLWLIILGVAAVIGLYCQKPRTSEGDHDDANQRYRLRYLPRYLR